MTRRSLAVAALLCCAASARAEQEWSGLRTRCREAGLTEAQAETLVAPLRKAEAEGLPTECIFIRIEEGLAKQVEPDRIATVAAARLDFMRQASRIVSSGGIHAGGDRGHLVQHVCMALESGLPESVLSEVFSRPGGYRYGRMIHVIEAGETLHLAGLAPAEVQLLMDDCLDRDLNRAEIVRVVDFVLAEQAKGRDFKTIHAELWITSGN